MLEMNRLAVASTTSDTTITNTTPSIRVMRPHEGNSNDGIWVVLY